MRFIIVLLSVCMLMCAGCDGSGLGGTYKVTFDVAGGEQGVVYSKGVDYLGNLPVTGYTTGESTSTISAYKKKESFENLITAGFGGDYSGISDFISLIVDSQAAGAFTVDTDQSMLKFNDVVYTISAGSGTFTTFGATVEGTFDITLGDGLDTNVQGTFVTVAYPIPADPE